MKGQYQDQVKRIARSCNKLPKGSPFLKEINIRTVDNYYHFFQDCWHLRDWIINDPNIGVDLEKRVKKFINESRYLRIVGSIANASKHLQLVNEKLVDRNIEMSHIKVKSADKEYKFICLYVNKQILEASTVAVESLKEWNQFFRSNKLNDIFFKL